MDKGTVVYLCWYDFAKKCENVYQGEVVDNDLWADTQWAGWVNVQFTPSGLTKPICHHFREEQLSLDAQNVPHDDCYLVCGQKTRFFEHDVTAKSKTRKVLNASDAWIRVQQFKREHWDDEHGHLMTDAIDDFYQMWRDAIAVRLGMMQQHKPQNMMKMECPSTPAEAMQPQRRIVSDEKMEELKEQLKEVVKPRKLTAREKRSTGRIEYQNAVQTSIFD